MNHRTNENNLAHFYMRCLFVLFFRCGKEQGGWRENMATPWSLWGTQWGQASSRCGQWYGLLKSTRKLHLVYQIKGILLVLWAALLQIFKVSQSLEIISPHFHHRNLNVPKPSLFLHMYLPWDLTLVMNTLSYVKALEPQLSAAWEASKPFFHQLGKVRIV